jgi:hypothetical protein
MRSRPRRSLRTELTRMRLDAAGELDAEDVREIEFSLANGF